MALSDLAVYSEYAYSAMTEVLAQQIDLFNSASSGAITLAGSAHQGDFSDIVQFAKVTGLVRRRNAYGTGAVSEKVMTNLVDTMVKVAAGIPPVRLDPGQFSWIQMNPQLAGAILGQQLAKDLLADMLNVAIGSTYVALAQVTTNYLDITGQTAPADKLSFLNLNSASALMGDSANELVAWVMHSKSMFDLYANALTNTEKLFVYGTVNVVRDPFGRVMIQTDSPNLLVAGTPNVYRILGLVPGAAVIGQNNDWFANEQTINGDENIKRTYQAEWSYQLGIKGFQWDKTNGGKSPNDAALLTATNWDKFATSYKDIAGVAIKAH